MRLDRSWAIVLVVAASLQSSHAAVEVWQGTQNLPTYEEAQPDPNPPFDQFSSNRFNYPYPLRNQLTNHRSDHAWRAVFLENEYLKCSLLPDLGGHVYTCMDKISGKPMFYANPSIKKADIGYRGAWAAFGIEFNFPVSHNWVSLSPVAFAFGKKADGSASVTVGNVDRVYGMEWNVELILRPQSTVLEERVTLSNRSDVRHRFYWWNNGAVEVWDDSRIEYPMRFAASHGFTQVTRWPVDEDGVDLSIIGNQRKGPVSLFVHGSREPFMGVWNPKTDTGTVHFANYRELPAKKIWSWGVDADGLDWRKALSDNNSAYVEIQAGLFRNQETYGLLEPRQSIHFSEYWMPARQLGGISRANLAGVASLRRVGERLAVALNVNQPIPAASVSILKENKRLLQEKVDLRPEKTWRSELPVPEPSPQYRFELRDHKGELLLGQTEGEYDWLPESEIHVGPQPRFRVPPANERREGDWLELGDTQERNGQVLLALETYKDGLSRFSGSPQLKKAAGRLAASLLHFEEADELLGAVHDRETTDGETSYYLGIAYEGVGKMARARDMYEQSMRLPQFRAAAALRLGELMARTGDLSGAERTLVEGLDAAPGDLRLAEELAAVERSVGHNAEAAARARDWRARFPLSYFLAEESGASNSEELARDSNRILQVAAEYMRVGLYGRALAVLSRPYPHLRPDELEPGAVSPEANPLIAYFRGYAKDKLGQPAQADYQAASQLSPTYVFPSSGEELAVLEAASGSNPQDSTAHYLLGTLYFSRGLVDRALAEWSAAGKQGVRMLVLDASRGRALLEVKDDPQGAIAAFRDGLVNDPHNVAVYYGLDQALSILGRPAEERVEVLEKYPDAAMPSDLVYELILNLAEQGSYERATALFRNRFFARQEGGTNVRQVWIEVKLQHALTLARQSHCGEALGLVDNLSSPAGDLSFTRDGLDAILQSARVHDLRASILSRCGRRQEAEEHFKRAATAIEPDQMVWASMAARDLPGFNDQEWKARLAQARIDLERDGELGAWHFYELGLLDDALGHREQARAEFRKVFLWPDRSLVYHLTRLAQSASIQ